MGIHSNIDSKLTEAQKQEAEQFEKVAEYVERKEKDTKDSDFKAKEWVKGRDNAVPESLIKETRGEEFAPVKPLGWEYDEDNRLIWKLGPYHFEMVKQGRVCHACLEWQTDLLTPRCHWRGKNEGCGAPRVGNANPTELFGRK